MAFANKGAKDVTQRYIASVLAADKLRDNAWWDETLKPLRKNEVGAVSHVRDKTLAYGLRPALLVRNASLRARHNAAEA